MDNSEFFREINRLVNKGETYFPEYDLDIEAFSHLNQLKRKQRFSRIVFFLLGCFVLFTFAAAFYYFTTPGGLTRLKYAIPNSERVDIIKREVLFDSILTENLHLKTLVAELQKEKQSDEREAVGILREPINDVTQQKQSAGSANLIYHEVQLGETLFSLAKKYYGSGSMVTKLMEENNITDPSQLAVGMTLSISKE